MPLVDSTYTPPAYLRNGHALTLWATLCRKHPPVPESVERQRLNTPDGDFVDVDITRADPAKQSRRALILSHGLEGNSRRSYMLGASAVFLHAGWDVLARNFRACSGELNRTPRMYHFGETDDLHLVVRHAETLGYETIVLTGFSLGGNQTLRYLAEDRVPESVRAGVVISVPCEVTSAAKVLAQPSRAVYMAYFMHSLKRKMRHKHNLFPNLIPVDGLWRMTTFEQFDNAYTAPLHGFASAHDYWERTSSLKVLHNITIPTLIINAKDDPFLSPGCYPVDIARKSSFLYLEMPEHGGHVGFVDARTLTAWGPYWDENRVLEFVREVLGNENI